MDRLQLRVLTGKDLDLWAWSGALLNSMLDFPKIAPNTEKSLIPKEYWIGQEA